MKTGRKKEEGFTIKPDTIGLLMTNTFLSQNKDGDELITYEVAEFDGVTKENQKRYDVTNRKHKSEIVYRISIKNEESLITTPIELKNILHKGKRSHKTKINREAEFYFIEFCEKIKPINKKLVNCFTFIDGKYLGNPEYQLYQEVNSTDKNKIEPVEPGQDYHEFNELKPDKNKVMELISLINDKLTRNTTEKSYYKMILSWSVASFIKFELARLGVKLHPILIIIGERNKGKSTAAEICISHLWNSQIYTDESFKGSPGARIRQFSNDSRPVMVDELESFENFNSILKNSAVRGYIDIPRGSKDGSVQHIKKFQNLAITTNNFKISDSALKQRCSILYYEDCGKSKISSSDFAKIIDNIKHVGKTIYNELISFDFKKILEDSYKKYSYLDQRSKDKIAYFEVGAAILNKFQILPDVALPEESILNLSDTSTICLKDELLDVIKSIFQKLNINNINKDINGEKQTFSIFRVLDEKYINENIYYSCASKGIFFTTGFKHILITTDILPDINKGLASKGISKQFKGMLELASELNLDYKNYPYRVESPLKITTKRGICVFERKKFLAEDDNDV